MLRYLVTQSALPMPRVIHIRYAPSANGSRGELEQWQHRAGLYHRQHREAPISLPIRLPDASPPMVFDSLKEERLCRVVRSASM